ncbi:MAG: hypothetical protein RLZZ553_125 [Verrucomicrobiota bacterium]
MLCRYPAQRLIWLALTTIKMESCQDFDDTQSILFDWFFGQNELSGIKFHEIVVWLNPIMLIVSEAWF